jgi:hypothetical protein
MYRSKAPIIDKTQQVRAAYDRIASRKGQIVLEKKGRYSADLDFHAFVTAARSIFQYALKEVEESKKTAKVTYKRRLKLYEDYVGNVPIFRFFAKLRDEEIHVGPATHSVTVTLGPKGSEPKVKYRIMRRLETGPSTFRALKKAGRDDLAEGMKKGGVIYQAAECDGEDDLFELCERYIEEIEKFVDFGVENGFIT